MNWPLIIALSVVVLTLFILGVFRGAATISSNHDRGAGFRE